LDLQLVDVTLKRFTNGPEGLVGEKLHEKTLTLSITQKFSSAKHCFVTAAKLCRGVGDRFFESIYENKTRMITKKAIVV